MRRRRGQPGRAAALVCLAATAALALFFFKQPLTWIRPPPTATIALDASDHHPNVLKADAKGVGFQGALESLHSPAFFRLVGGNMIAGPLLVSAASKLANLDAGSQWTAQTCESSACLSKTHSSKASCKWCPASFSSSSSSSSALCVFGTLALSTTRVPLKHPDECKWCVVDRVPESIARERSYSVLASNASEPAKVRFITLLATCALSAPVTGEGVVKSSALGPDFVAQVAAPVVVAPSSKLAENVVCGRAIFGDISTNSLATWVHHYTQILDFDFVVIYQVGFSAARMASLRPFVDSGKLVVVDLRDALQATYGALFWDILLFSSYVGQGLVKVDCALRAQSLGASWVLHVDMDELLVAPSTEPSPPWKWTNIVAPYATADIVSFRRKSDASPTGCEVAKDSWLDFIRVLRPLSLDCKARNSDDSCNELLGMNKVAMRIDGSRSLSPAGLGVHNFRFCGRLAPDAVEPGVLKPASKPYEDKSCVNDVQVEFAPPARAYLLCVSFPRFHAT